MNCSKCDVKLTQREIESGACGSCGAPLAADERRQFLTGAKRPGQYSYEQSRVGAVLWEPVRASFRWLERGTICMLVAVVTYLLWVWAQVIWVRLLGNAPFAEVWQTLYLSAILLPSVEVVALFGLVFFYIGMAGCARAPADSGLRKYALAWLFLASGAIASRALAVVLVAADGEMEWLAVWESVRDSANRWVQILMVAQLLLGLIAFVFVVLLMFVTASQGREPGMRWRAVAYAVVSAVTSIAFLLYPLLPQNYGLEVIAVGLAVFAALALGLWQLRLLREIRGSLG